MILIKIVIIVAIVLVVLFLLSLVIYFFNLDMKLASSMIPFMNRHYDRAAEKREQRKKKNESV
jgi:flagellar basal body-associated protein FliL